MVPRQQSQFSFPGTFSADGNKGTKPGVAGTSLDLLRRICSHNPLLTELLLQALTPVEQAQLSQLMAQVEGRGVADSGGAKNSTELAAGASDSESGETDIDLLGERPTADDATRPTVMAPPDSADVHHGARSAGDEYLARVLRLLMDRDGEDAERFDLLNEIGRGGMGVIYRAWDRQLGRTVAIKAMHAHDIDKSLYVRRFITEARIHGRLTHPGIAPVHAIGVLPDHRPYIAMRCVEGETLSALLAKRKSASEDLPSLLRIFERVCDVIAYAHAQGVIHRDLKPENVIVGRFGLVKVMDWGLAKVIGQPDDPSDLMMDGSDSIVNRHDDNGGDSGFSETDMPEADMLDKPGTLLGTQMGTMAYAAPEQIRGDSGNVDYRSDVFSLGAILCEILTGLPPYQNSDPAKLYREASRADLEEVYARIDQSGEDGVLIDLARRCLSVDPEERFSEARHVAFIVTSAIESHLQRVERELVRFFDLSLDLCCIAGLDGYFRRLNANFPRVLGYTEAELLAHPFLHFVHPDDHAATIEAMEDLERGQPVVRFRNRYLHASGHYLWLEWGSQSVPEEGVVYAVARDVTSFMSDWRLA